MKINASSLLLQLPERLGVIGGVGLALAFAAGVLVASLSWPLYEENRSLEADIARLQRKSRHHTAAPQAAAGPRTEAEVVKHLSAFVASLPPETTLNERLNDLHELAAKYRLTLANAEYRAASGQGLAGKLVISIKTEGRYSDIREFLLQLPVAMPAMTPVRVSLSRPKLSAGVVEAALELNLHYAPGKAPAKDAQRST